MKHALIAAAAIVVGSAAWVAQPSARTYEHARAVGKRCSTCHDSKRPDATNLNAAGRYFLTHRSLEGYTPGAPAKETAVKAGAVSGKAVYDETCAACHGPRGEGTQIAGTLVGPRKYARTEADAIRVIRSGIDGTAMAPFAGALTDAQIRAVARYVTGLRARAK